jgi:hypothetical protein
MKIRVAAAARIPDDAMAVVDPEGILLAIWPLVLVQAV